jgi:hypothetical protein
MKKSASHKSDSASVRDSIRVLSCFQKANPKLTTFAYLPKIDTLDSFDSWNLPIPAIKSRISNLKSIDFGQSDEDIPVKDDSNEIILEMQRTKMKSIISKITSSNIVHIRIPTFLEQTDGFKSFDMPLEVLKASETIIHIINCSTEFKERGRHISFPHISIQAMTVIIDYIERKYLTDMQYDLNMFDPFDIPLDGALEILDYAMYFSLPELMDICVAKVTTNFDSITHSNEKNWNLLETFLPF